MSYSFINNVPDDWNTYYYDCGCHASSGCDCDENNPKNSNRPWLANSDYDFSYQDSMWEKVISRSWHTCRKDHKDGRIKKGQKYRKSVWRMIDDETGKSWHMTVTNLDS